MQMTRARRPDAFVSRVLATVRRFLAASREFFDGLLLPAPGC